MRKEELCGDSLLLRLWASPERKEALEKNTAYHLGVEITSKCLGSCNYCFSSSNAAGDITIPTERLLRLVDESKEIGIKMVFWYGGETLLHPDWYKILDYARQKGLGNFIVSSGIISKKEARQICNLMKRA